MGQGYVEDSSSGFFAIYIDGELHGNESYVGSAIPKCDKTVVGSGFVGSLDSFTYYTDDITDAYVSLMYNRVPSWVEPVLYYIYFYLKC